MTTTLRNAWLTPAPVQTHRFVMTPQGRGYLWDHTTLEAQIKRNGIVVCFGDDKPASYYTRDEISFEER